MSFKKIIFVKGNKYLIEPSKRENKKYDVHLVFNNKEFGIGVLKDNEFVKRYICSFGDKRYEQYKDKIGYYKSLDHNDKERRKQYKERHKNDYINDPNYSGFWSYRYLW